MPTIAVTGATGNIGRSLVARLARRPDTKVRAIGRTARNLEPLVATGAEGRVGDLGDAAFLDEVFRGADAAFVMVPPRYDAGDLKREQRSVARCLVDALREAKVPRLAVLSSVGAEIPTGTGPVEALHDLEAWTKRLPARTVTILRPTFFMENLLTALPAIASSGVFPGRLPPDLPVPMVATKDVADAALRALTETPPEPRHVRYLLGSRDVTHAEAARICGEAVGLPDLPYVQVEADAFRDALLGMGLSPSVASAFLELYAAAEDGRLLANAVRGPGTDTVTTLEQFARDTFAPAYRAATGARGPA